MEFIPIATASVITAPPGSVALAITDIEPADNAEGAVIVVVDIYGPYSKVLVSIRSTPGCEDPPPPPDGVGKGAGVGAGGVGAGGVGAGGVGAGGVGVRGGADSHGIVLSDISKLTGISVGNPFK